MSDTVIATRNVSKRYLIGEAEQRHETLAGSLIAAVKAPIRNYLKGGRVVLHGPTEEVVSAYLESGQALGAQWKAQEQGDQPLRFLSAEIRNPAGEISGNLDNLEDIRIDLEFEVREELGGTVVAVILHARDGALLFSTEDTDTHADLMECRPPGRYRSTVTIPGGLLNAGESTSDSVRASRGGSTTRISRPCHSPSTTPRTTLRGAVGARPISPTVPPLAGRVRSHAGGMRRAEMRGGPRSDPMPITDRDEPHLPDVRPGEQSLPESDQR